MVSALESPSPRRYAEMSSSSSSHSHKSHHRRGRKATRTSRVRKTKSTRTKKSRSRSSAPRKRTSSGRELTAWTTLVKEGWKTDKNKMSWGEHLKAMKPKYRRYLTLTNQKKGDANIKIKRDAIKTALGSRGHSSSHHRHHHSR